MFDLIKRWDGNPILSPNPDLPWATEQARNPGAVWDGQKVHMLYTTSASFGKGGDMVLGYAQSSDGFNFETATEPFMTSSPDPDDFDHGGLEDTRITQIGDTYYIAYAARAKHPINYWLKDHENWSPRTNPTWGQNFRRVGLAATKDWKTVTRLGPITSEEVSDANVVIFPEKIDGQYVMLHRPTQFHPGLYQCRYTPAPMWIAFSDDLLDWKWREDQAHAKWFERLPQLAHDHMLIRPEYEWESMKVGAAGVPMATDEGWLMFYHAVDVTGTYRVGLMLLDREDPKKVIARSPVPIMQPETKIEKHGIYKHGNGCVFPCANITINGEVLIYYGAADEHCCAATAKLDELLDYILTCRVSPPAMSPAYSGV